jgi:hypothetical protein
MVDVSCENSILNTNEKVYGLIYIITNSATTHKYVGQTLSHRKNKGKWRPFGIIGRFNDHVSEAINNTKRKQCSYLNNAIRKYGKDCFTVSLIQVCEVSQLNDLEQTYISTHNTLYPNGYNLTKGGKTTFIESKLDLTTLNVPKKRGGCTFRSEETRAKMSKRSRESIDDAFKAARVISATKQHHAKKLERFKDVKVDLSKIDSYIKVKGKAVIVCIDDQRASFDSKHDTIDQKKEKASQFIYDIHNATLSNCGKPVKPE